MVALGSAKDGGVYIFYTQRLLRLDEFQQQRRKR